MDLYDYLRQFVAGDIAHVLPVGGVVGLAVFIFINRVDAWLKSNDKPGLAPDVKFYGGISLCLLLPILAYLLVTREDQLKPTLEGTLLAGAVAVIAATVTHWGTGGSQTANAMHEASNNPGTPVKIDGSKASVTVHKPSAPPSN
jgi:hypothetical protein